MAKNNAIKPYKLANGETRYFFKIYLGIDPLTGERIETTRRSFKTTKAANEAYNALKFEYVNGQRPDKKTYQNIYEEWLVTYKKTVRPSTFRKTQQIFRDHILPKLGNTKIQSINFKHCEHAAFEWYEDLVKHKTVEQYASKVFDHAVNLNIITFNPMNRVKTPQKKKTYKDVSYYNREGLIEFLEAAKKESIKQHAYLRLLSYTGVRRAEGFAVCWNDINFDKNEIRINKAITYDDDGNLIIYETKTSDHRNLMIDDKTLEILLAWKQVQTDLFGTLTENNLIFSNSKNEISHPSKAWDWCNQIQSKYNLKKVEPHGLRRTHATLYYLSSATPYEIKKRLGHTFNDITSDVYIIEIDEIKIKAFENFVRYMDY